MRGLCLVMKRGGGYSLRPSDGMVNQKGADSRAQFRPPRPIVAARTSLLNFLRLLAQGREVDHGAANQSRSDFKRSLPRRDGSEYVVVFAQFHRSHSGFPVEDLEIPGTARVPDLGWDEVEDVAAGCIIWQGGQQARGLHRRNVAIGVDDVEDDVALADQLGRVRRRGDFRGGLVFDDLMVVEARVGCHFSRSWLGESQ